MTARILALTIVLPLVVSSKAVSDDAGRILVRNETNYKVQLWFNAGTDANGKKREWSGYFVKWDLPPNTEITPAYSDRKAIHASEVDYQLATRIGVSETKTASSVDLVGRLLITIRESDLPGGPRSVPKPGLGEVVKREVFIDNTGVFNRGSVSGKIRYRHPKTKRTMNADVDISRVNSRFAFDGTATSGRTSGILRIPTKQAYEIEWIEIPGGRIYPDHDGYTFVGKENAPVRQRDLTKSIAIVAAGVVLAAAVIKNPTSSKSTGSNSSHGRAESKSPFRTITVVVMDVGKDAVRGVRVKLEPSLLSMTVGKTEGTTGFDGKIDFKVCMSDTYTVYVAGEKKWSGTIEKDVLINVEARR